MGPSIAGKSKKVNLLTALPLYLLKAYLYVGKDKVDLQSSITDQIKEYQENELKVSADDG